MNKKQLKLLNYSYDLLAKKRYTIREMVVKLENRNLKLKEPCSEEESKEILETLARANLINDKEFALAYIDYRRRHSPIGRIKLRHELRKKGIDEGIIEQTINSSQLPETELAFMLARKKMNILAGKRYENMELKSRLLRYLASRGFTMEISYKALNELLESQNQHL